MSKLKPWAYGPFELIQHAEGHLQSSTDFDKRVALISYDNAIEVAITTFLQLHPSQRGGKTFSRKDIDQWMVNYHSKLDFFEQYVKSLNLSLQVTIDEIVWYHSLRNELYHSGNGMVPEERSLEGVRSAALWVFSILFDVDTEKFLAQKVPSPHPVAQENQKQISGQTELLYSIIGLEKMLRNALLSMGVLDSINEQLSLQEAWKLFSEHAGHLPRAYTSIFNQIHNARNAIVHARPSTLSSEQMSNLANKADEISYFVSAYSISTDILPDLRRKYLNWLRSEITSVRIVQKNQTVYLEITSQKTVHLHTGEEVLSNDEDVTRTDLSFIISDIEKEVRTFPAGKTASHNARKFIEQFDPYSIINCTDLFKPEIYSEIAARFGPAL